jgi:hypothetical protein
MLGEDGGGMPWVMAARKLSRGPWETPGISSFPPLAKENVEEMQWGYPLNWATFYSPPSIPLAPTALSGTIDRGRKECRRVGREQGLKGMRERGGWAGAARRWVRQRRTSLLCRRPTHLLASRLHCSAYRQMPRSSSKRKTSGTILSSFVFSWGEE